MYTTHKIIISTVDGDTMVEVNNEQFEKLHYSLTTYYNENFDIISNKD